MSWNLRDDSPGGADGFKLRFVQDSLEKRLNILAPILLTASFSCYLIFYKFRDWFSGYGAMIGIVRTEIGTPVSNTTKKQ